MDVPKYYNSPDDRYAEVEAVGQVIEGTDKCVTDHIRIIREISRDEPLRLSNTGEGNTGYMNSGKYNSGNKNAGDSNTGSYNDGNLNSGSANNGSRNTGWWNIGDHNTGNYNTGSWNTGFSNSGRCNTGICNTGDHNAGDYNSGKRNTGRGNAGNNNTGDYNVSNGNAGCFNTKTMTISMFNWPSNWTLEDWHNSRAYEVLCDMPTAYEDAQPVTSDQVTDEELRAIKHKADRQTWWDDLFFRDRRAVMALPNFDPFVFYQCTGIRV